jgi:glycosyltransferase involved in cell wall biosynthesis
MRVLHVLPTRAAEFGGPVKVAEEMARQLRPHGIECELFPEPGVELPQRVAYYPGLRRSLALAAAVRRADLVHVHGLWTLPTTGAAACSRAAKKPYIVTPHGMLDRWCLRQSTTKKRVYAAVAERRMLRRASSIHFFNAEEAAEAQDFIELPNYFLLPNGVKVADFADLPGRAELEAMLPLARGRVVALYLGRIHHKKGLDVFLPAMAKVADPTLLLVVAGPDEGGYKAEVEAQATSLGIDRQIHFVGPVAGEEKRRLLGGSDFFVLSSHQEGDSVAIKEALAAGLPVLISDKCHQPEVDEARAGVVTADTIDGVVEGLRVMLRADERAARAAFARRFAERYDSAALATRLASIYQAVVNGRELP